METILVVTPTRELPPQVLPTLPDSGQVLLSSKLFSDWMTNQTNIHYFSFHANQGSPTTSTRGLTTSLIAEGFLCNLYCLYFHYGKPTTTRREQSWGDKNWSQWGYSLLFSGFVYCIRRRTLPMLPSSKLFWCCSFLSWGQTSPAIASTDHIWHSVIDRANTSLTLLEKLEFNIFCKNLLDNMTFTMNKH